MVISLFRVRFLGFWCFIVVKVLVDKTEEGRLNCLWVQMENWIRFSSGVLLCTVESCGVSLLFGVWFRHISRFLHVCDDKL